PVHDARAARDEVLATLQPGGACDGHGGAITADCRQRLDAANDDVDAHERGRAVGMVGAGVGVAALAAGATLLLTGDDPERYDLAGVAEREGGGLAFRVGIAGTLPTVLLVGMCELGTTGSPGSGMDG